ncbi:2TM domain-containing protein [Bizionia argentinensis JUB59]|uniref:2TM domain-containing protein n=1 Tax=Bizionia argentinensis JUB59 TaxID=1046627 RepID=G2EBE2_9FLAO|nr:2TM domain-containing protein [Bizionia argentinensis]EGV44467.1 2TM domain-containing protein [Bizionia argentinensis JUB59]
MESNYNFEKRSRIEQAKSEVKKLKGFYSHLLVFVVINLMIVVINVQALDSGESYFQFKNFFTLGFWGFGLLIHGLSVFLPNWILGKDWEERKIKELMNRYRKQ